MPILELPPNPSRTNGRTETPDDQTGIGEPTPSGAPGSKPPNSNVKVRTGRWGELEEHELIHLLDALDDERARAQFRESVYISTIFCLAIAWFLFYGPRVIFHQPRFQDPIALMKQHDREITLTMPPRPPAPKAPPKIDRKTMDTLKKEQAQQQVKAPPTPEPPVPQQPAPSQEQAHNTAPPVPQPLAPLPTAPKPAPSVEAPMPSAPHPNIAQNSQSARDAIRDAMRGAMRGGGGEVPSGPGGPVQAGATILTDTQGVDFNAYLRRIVADTKRNWEPLIPQEVNPPLLKRGVVGIRFTILQGGQIGAMTLETASGDVALDRAAWGAITSEGAFPPLPTQFHGPQIELRFVFMYNIQPPQ
jgi:TonB family protein